MWQLPKPDDLAVVCYTSGTTGTCHCITDFDVDPNVHLQRCQLLEILSLENFPFAALCPAITAHPTPHTQVNLSPNLNVSIAHDIKLKLHDIKLLWLECCTPYHYIHCQWWNYATGNCEPYYGLEKKNHCWILGKLFGLNSKLKQRKAEKSTLSWINRKTGRLVLYQWETSGSVRASSAEFCYPILEETPKISLS